MDYSVIEKTCGKADRIEISNNGYVTDLKNTDKIRDKRGVTYKYFDVKNSWNTLNISVDYGIITHISIFDNPS